MGALQPVRVAVLVRLTPPTDTRQPTVITADPCSLTASAAMELDMSTQLLSVSVVLPEKRMDCEALGLSARTQASAAVWKTATARPSSMTGLSLKIAVKYRDTGSWTITSTAFAF